MIVIGVIAVLLFGERLPEVGRSLGRSLIEFKKGLRGIEDELRSATTSAPTPARTSFDSVEHEEAAGVRFEPPAREPQDESPAS
ncbi:MAG: twin-arginine translocase TatA/TatE family subunit [Pirellulales bacterium]|nr:twin-arginine translocase TatA/TatE family subunit [Pirellulales bacterium]